MTNTLTTEEFAGKVVGDVAAAMSGVMTALGHKLGLYKAMAGAGWQTPDAIAAASGTFERYVREWLGNQVAGGYIQFDEASNRYQLPDAFLPVLVNTDSPMFLVPALEVAASLWLDEEKLLSAFKTGEGISWGQHHHRLFCGSESLFRPGYKAFLVDEWLQAVDGLTDRLKAGATVADVGCGHGASTILLANAFPQSRFMGYDLHEESIRTASERAREDGNPDNLEFVVSDAKSYDGESFDLICFMDCLHDMGDPVGAARHARSKLKSGGVALLVEPAAGNSLGDNCHPVGRLYYAASTAVCTPCSHSQEVKAGLGAQAGPARLSAVMQEAGFSRVEQVAATPFNIILAAYA